MTISSYRSGSRCAASSAIVACCRGSWATSPPPLSRIPSSVLASACSKTPVDNSLTLFTKSILEYWSICNSGQTAEPESKSSSVCLKLFRRTNSAMASLLGEWHIQELRSDGGTPDSASNAEPLSTSNMTFNAWRGSIFSSNPKSSDGSGMRQRTAQYQMRSWKAALFPHQAKNFSRFENRMPVDASKAALAMSPTVTPIPTSLQVKRPDCTGVSCIPLNARASSSSRFPTCGIEPCSAISVGKWPRNSQAIAR